MMEYHSQNAFFFPAYRKLVKRIYFCYKLNFFKYYINHVFLLIVYLLISPQNLKL